MKQCTKQCHGTVREAVAHSISLERKDGTERGAYNHYWCPTCKAWHVGHRTVRSRLSRARRG